MGWRRCRDGRARPAAASQPGVPAPYSLHAEEPPDRRRRHDRSPRPQARPAQSRLGGDAGRRGARGQDAPPGRGTQGGPARPLAARRTPRRPAEPGLERGALPRRRGGPRPDAGWLRRGPASPLRIRPLPRRRWNRPARPRRHRRRRDGRRARKAAQGGRFAHQRPPLGAAPPRPARRQVGGRHHLQNPERIRAQGRPAHRDPRARGRREGFRARSGAARRHGVRQDLHHGAGDRRDQPPRPHPGAEQDPGGAALRRVQELLPRQRCRIFRILLRLLSARGLRAAVGHLHREGIDHQRADRPDAPRRHPVAAGARTTSSSSPPCPASTASARSRPTRR